MTGLTLIQTDLIFASLDLIRLVLTHDSILPPPADEPVPPKFPIYASRIRQVVEKEGYELVGYLLSGLTGDFPEDSSSNVITIFRNVAAVWPQQLLSWLPSVLQRLNPATVTDEAKTKFLAETTRFVPSLLVTVLQLMRSSSTVNGKQWDKIKYAILGLHRQSLKSRERRRTALDRQ
jgi:transportin-3